MKINTFSAKFGLFAEIEAAGYHHGATFFYGLKKAGRSSSKQEGASWLPTADRARKATRFDILPDFNLNGQILVSPIAKTNLMIIRAAERRDSGSYSFTDLAQALLVSSLCKNFSCNTFNYYSTLCARMSKKSAKTCIGDLQKVIKAFALR